MDSTDNFIETLTKKRPRGRPKKSPNDSHTFGPTTYNGPSPHDVQAWSDQQVTESFEALGVEPRPSLWGSDDERNLAKFSTSDDDVDLATLKARADALMAVAHRRHLAFELILGWVETLGEKASITELERLEGRNYKTSEMRYAKQAELQAHIARLIYAKLISEGVGMQQQ